jgi:hypothetical protein
MNKMYIVSGEGIGAGMRQEYTGKMTRRAMRARLTREKCGGDRWAFFVAADGRRVFPEQYA